MPDFAHFEEEVYEGKSRSDRVKESRKRELTRYVFPRPFALSSLPHKDISMQNIENDDGEFRMYQVCEKVIFCTFFFFYFVDDIVCIGICRESGECSHCRAARHLGAVPCD